MADLLPPTYGCSPALLLNSTNGSSASSSAQPGVIDGAVPGESSSQVSNVLVHPLVLLSVLDHHTRRQEGAGRVIGTLLGKRDGDLVEITNCFAVPHAERGDEVAIGKDFNRQMLALHLRANKRETVVGWYATSLPSDGDSADTTANASSKCIADTSSLIHEFYAGECDEDPIHLVVDTSLVNDAIALRAYKSAPVVVKGETLANLFHEIRLCVKSSESERICVDRMVKAASPHGSGDVLVNPADNTQVDETHALELSMAKLLEMIETCSAYVDGVIANSSYDEPGVEEMGREILDSLNVVPRIRPAAFDKMFDDSLQDLLMVTYLSNITKTQLVIAEKLNASLGK